MRTGIAATLIADAGYGHATGGAEEAARLLADRGWSETAWSNRTPQIIKCLTFCDEDGRCPLPEDEGDILAYIGYLSVENRIGASSLPQFISAVSRYHIHHHFPSPTLTPLVRALVTAYTLQANIDAPSTTSHIGLSVSAARCIVNLGLYSNDPATIMMKSAMVTFSFLFQVLSVTAEAVQLPDLVWTEQGLEVHLTR